jgi:hypothetical protein
LPAQICRSPHGADIRGVPFNHCRVTVFLLDTNIVSELRKSRPNTHVITWLKEVADADLHLSAATVGEIQAGIELTRARRIRARQRNSRPGLTN